MENSECFHKMQTKAKHEFTIKLELIEIQFQCKHYCYASSKLMHIHNKICHPYGNNLIISKYNKSAQAKGTCIVHTEICWPSFALCAPRPMPIRMMLLFFLNTGIRQTFAHRKFEWRLKVSLLHHIPHGNTYAVRFNHLTKSSIGQTHFQGHKVLFSILPSVFQACPSH